MNDADLNIIDRARVIRQASRDSKSINLPLHTSGLLEAGLTRRRLDELVADGTLRRLRTGWFADGSTHDAVATAVAAGGTLTCVSALVAHGGWSIDDRRLHVRSPESRAPRRTRSTSDMVRHGSRGRSLPRPATTLVDDPLDALRCASVCLSAEALVIVTDAALNRRLVSPVEFESFVESLPATERSRFESCTPTAGSGSESRVRFFFEQLGVKVETQFNFAPREFADLLVDGWLAIECDPVEHHAVHEQFTTDRRRTLDLQRGWYYVVRLTYADIWYRWDDVSAFLLELVRRGPDALRRGDATTGRRLRRRGA